MELGTILAKIFCLTVHALMLTAVVKPGVTAQVKNSRELWKKSEERADVGKGLRGLSFLFGGRFGPYKDLLFDLYHEYGVT